MAKTFASAAKAIMNKYKTRLGENFDKGDTLALEAMNQELNTLREKQEAVRNKKNITSATPLEYPAYAYGSFLEDPNEPNRNNEEMISRFQEIDKILKKPKGVERDNALTTALSGGVNLSEFVNQYNLHAGQPVLEHTTDELGEKISILERKSLPVIRQKDPVEPQESDDKSRRSNRVLVARRRSRLGELITGDPIRMKSVRRPKFAEGGRLQSLSLNKGLDLQLPILQNIEFNRNIPPRGSFFNRVGDKFSRVFKPMEEGSEYRSRVPWMGMASGILGNLLMNREIDMPAYEYRELTPERASPNLVSYGREREQIMTDRDLAMQTIAGGARNLGSASGLMENLQAGVTGTQRVAGQQFGQSLQNEGNVNAQIRNQVAQFNATQQARAQEANERNRMIAYNMDRENAMINAERRDSRIKGISDSVTGFFRDRMRADQYDTQLAMMTPENYRAGVGRDSPWRRFLGLSPNMRMMFRDTGDALSTPTTPPIPPTETVPINAYGGHLGSISLFGDDDYEKIMMRSNMLKNKKR